ncbi:DUF1614 domain-containing protein [Fuchsiella alkaliacetigena]|uniref:DUF1614 domain-containing protein n=1 Tax=Fuchsiella alkaliacetigena TaxID=957042 RepID=UPI00200AAF4C|nr:DUF1614 domain-containing protein [Fuchsiella alkaliacetigena]MCK8823934.1 DUF1614 domain-containing protein [Fuchsiella alkaliacetigena]
MPLGVILLIVASILIYLGFAQRILDRMYLTDKQAILFLLLMIVGSFIDIPITTAVSLNIGGAVLPVILAFYVLFRADSTQEWVRTVFSVLVTGGVIYALNQSFQGVEIFFDPFYIYGIIAGITAYLTSRSRRNAFISGTLGFLIYDLINVGRITFGGQPGEAFIGGAGALDTIVVSGLVAVLLAELIGETNERLQSGTDTAQANRDDDMEYADLEAVELEGEDIEGDDKDEE